MSSKNAFDYIYKVYEETTIGVNERFYCILLDNNNNVKGYSLISIGGITGTIVDIRILYALALKTLSTALILVHNHPSGTEKPSRADTNITEKIKKAGDLLDIKVLDHIIVTPQRTFFSFADNGMI